MKSAGIRRRGSRRSSSIRLMWSRSRSRRRISRRRARGSISSCVVRKCRCGSITLSRLPRRQRRIICLCMSVWWVILRKRWAKCSAARLLIRAGTKKPAPPRSFLMIQRPPAIARRHSRNSSLDYISTDRAALPQRCLQVRDRAPHRGRHQSYTLCLDLEVHLVPNEGPAEGICLLGLSGLRIVGVVQVSPRGDQK